ncbi:SDR family oxidoreductase [Pseudonocardia sp. NPDC049154]|uniref:SDR family oxidoreductase n=1 Tax=Pseudonocardia sp. NPDC049154 TaxID=3155501 RepID=UPI0033C13DEC
MVEAVTRRVAIVTGAGRGIGRSHALELGRRGFAVVVNDVGTTDDGDSVAEEVAAEIRAAGGQALGDTGDVSDWDAAGRMVASAVDTFGRLDAVVNNAGNLRDKMFVNMTPEDWDAVIAVHLRGTFCLSRRAADHWRALSKAGRASSGRLINTTSGAGLFGNIGQANYVAAKAGIAGLTLALAAELERYGVTVNAVAPIARSRMTEKLFASQMSEGSDFDRFDPVHVSRVVAWLADEDSADVTGRVFSVTGGRVSVVGGWRFDVEEQAERDLGDDEIGPIVRSLLEKAPEPVPVRGTEKAELKVERANA